MSAPGRNIPAYAGKTVRDPHMCFNAGEHPRVCGENNNYAAENASDLGTSPRMRGKLFAETPEGLRLRNIPAYAGKTI